MILSEREDLLITEYTEKNILVEESFGFEQTGFFFALRLFDFSSLPIHNSFEYLDFEGWNYIDQDLSNEYENKLI